MSKATDFIISLLGKGGKRLLKMYFPRDDGPAAGLLINRLVAEEHVSRDFEYLVTVLSDDETIQATEVQGRMVCVEVLGELGAGRFFNGYCTGFGLESVHDGVATYQMVLKPWLSFFALRHDWRLFHNQSISNQSKTVFLETGLASHEFRLQQPDPIRTFSCQYDETDYNYLHRRWEEMGWHYWYEHDLSGHKLVISDTSRSAPAVDGKATLSLHHGGGSNRHDRIAQWKPHRKVVSGRISLSGFDFKKPAPRQHTQVSGNEQGDIHKIEVYQYTGLYGFSTPEHVKDLAQLRMEAHDAQSWQIRALSNCRPVQPGRSFKLGREFMGQLMGKLKEQDDEFFVLSVRHVVDNNYLNNDGSHASYENEFICVPKRMPWRAPQGYNSHPVKANGIDTATVVGPEGQDIHTDEYGRIRIQFHWDREGQNDAGSSAWVRVASNWAGAELGAMALPRIGTEVIVQWLSASPDRPLVTGSVYNARKMPPWQLPGQQALSGIRSRELTPGSGNAASGRSNHLIFDDTHQKIQVQLKSDHQHSQLSLGHITRIESNAGRKDERGEGFELRTDGWGVLRAARGMLLSTEKRTQAEAHVKDMGETIERLHAAHALHKVQAEVAQEHGAQDAKSHQSEIEEALKIQYEAVKGKEGPKAELDAAHLVLASPAGIEATTPKTVHLAAGDHVALTSGKSLSLASADGLFASIRKTFRLFVQKAGMKLVAAGGDIDIKALAESVNVLAKLNITHSANRITISAKEEIVLNAGGTYVRYNASGIEQGTSGSHISHAATHSFIGPNNQPLKVPEERANYGHKFQLTDLLGKALAEEAYTIITTDHQEIRGKTDAQGMTEQILSEHPEGTYIIFDRDLRWEVEEEEHDHDDDLHC